MTTLYDRLSAAGCDLDSHESDLYVKDTAEARAYIKAAQDAGEVRTWRPFVADDGSGRWMDVPFAFSPWWRARGFS